MVMADRKEWWQPWSGRRRLVKDQLMLSQGAQQHLCGAARAIATDGVAGPDLEEQSLLREEFGVDPTEWHRVIATRIRECVRHVLQQADREARS